MIISIRGTSGSGKSTIARRVMELYANKSAVFEAGRKQPILYRLKHPNGGPDLAVIGHYETACGGCDTIHEFDEVFKWVNYCAERGMDVLFEGVLLYCEVPRTVMLQLTHGVTVIALNTPIDECVASVNLRRWEKGDPEPVNPKNTETKHRGTVTTMATLEASGVPVVWCNREEAFSVIRNQFNLP